MMESMRESWTDERLDDLNAKVDRGFERLSVDLRLQRVETRTEFAALRGETKAEFAGLREETRTEFAAVRNEMKSGFERMGERFERVSERFEALHRLLFRAACVVGSALIGLIATQL
jgi:hypothetical protein